MSEVHFETQVKDGIERVSCRPSDASHPTPILFLHGMWHAAWCWRDWQQVFAEAGWESHAFSLPGHGQSARRKSVRFTTMDDYLKVVTSEIARFPKLPILIGHSMGGALAQWYLKKVADDLPAVVMLASWTSHSTFADGTSLHLKRDPWGFLKMGFTMSAGALVRSPKWAASMLITEGATIRPEELHARLDEESYLVLSQHNPPLWKPKEQVASPMLWVAAEKDAVISLKGASQSARFYGAEFLSVPNAGHNLMMEANHAATAHQIERWLSAKGL
jgi:pimeloyl-ACP methyl ester carboxylesterase